MIFYFRTYKNSERRAQRQTKTQVFRVCRKFAIFYHLYAGACASCGSAAADRKNACIIKTTTTIRNIRTRFLHGRNGYRVNVNNVKQKATVMLQNALPKRNFLPPPGERKKICLTYFKIPRTYFKIQGTYFCGCQIPINRHVTERLFCSHKKVKISYTTVKLCFRKSTTKFTSS